MDTSLAKAGIEADLLLSGSAKAPFSDSLTSSRVLTFSAFGEAEPESYSEGDFIDLVTRNDVTASLSVSIPSGVSNPDRDYILIESILSGVQITGNAGNTFPGSALANALNDGALVLASPTASQSVTLNDSITEMQGELVPFTFSASHDLSFSNPFGGSGGSDMDYFANPTVNLSLRRDTDYARFQLVASAEEPLVVPEPSSLCLIALSGIGILRRRRN